MTGTTSFLPGDGFGLVGAESKALVRCASGVTADSQAQLARLWRLVREGAPTADIVAELLGRPAGEFADVGLVRLDGPWVDVVVRGDVVVELFPTGGGEAVLIPGPEVTEQHRRPAAFTIRGISVASPPRRPPFEVERGLVPASALHVAHVPVVADAGRTERTLAVPPAAVVTPVGTPVVQERPTPSDVNTIRVRRRRATLVFDTGERVEVTGNVVIGRKPSMPMPNTGETPQLVTLARAGKGLSRSHALIEVDGGEMRIVDLDSSNGVAIERDGEWFEVDPGASAPLRIGTRVDLGGAAQFVVEEEP